MLKQRNRCQADENRAVSPVIGVILMVAITVILAAVIGAFVLEIGDQQETAPNASFSTNEQVMYANYGGADGNVTVVDVTHAGGDALPVSQTQLALDGNTSVWGFDDSTKNIGSTAATQASPYPNFCETVGGGSAEVTSGQTLRAVASGGEHEEITVKGNGYDFETPPSDERILKGVDASKFTKHPAGRMASCAKKPFGISVDDSYPRVAIGFWHSGAYRGMLALSNVPMSGDKVQMIWEASSGGKTQTLFEYTVQTDSPMAN